MILNVPSFYALVNHQDQLHHFLIYLFRNRELILNFLTYSHDNLPSSLILSRVSFILRLGLICDYPAFQPTSVFQGFPGRDLIRSNATHN
jgi:hypothetical protein